MNGPKEGNFKPFLPAKGILKISVDGIIRVITEINVSLATFMRQVLTNPNGGYYTTRDQGSEILGKKGDFITSPEIIQVFLLVYGQLHNR
jgi:SAM-dependent MidA family methyltransferase